MPLYEYQCKACGAISEILTSMDAHCNALQCKNCGSQALEKKLSAFSIGALACHASVKNCCDKKELCGTIHSGNEVCINDCNCKDV